MLFNSIEFAIFLPIVFFLYWFVTKGNLRVQNILLLAASYFFYASWDYRFLFLLIFSTFLDYFTGIMIFEAKTKKLRSFWLWLSISINLGFLGVFKYFNFFAESFSDALSLLGFHADFWTLQVILPVGISFYTFHGLSYVIDLYNKKITPERNFINYSVFVSFFPLLVAGPIERATHLLPQVVKKRVFDYANAVDGMQQIVWGLFKKIVVADNCAPIVDQIFSNPAGYSGSELVLGSVLFAFQIYGDFSGYSDIAIGTARLFGITLLRNFAYPYFARDIAEFWRRWHISLTTWFRDYLYIPIGGSRGTKWMNVRNTFIVFLVSGFWHGANWTFIAWGFLNALFFLPLLLFEKNRQNIEIAAKGKIFPSLKDITGMAVTFGLTLLAWIFFRSDSISSAFSFIRDIFDASLFTWPGVKLNYIWVFILLLIIIEWISREKQHGLQLNGLKMHRSLKWALVMAVCLAIFIFGNFNKTEFIYFAF